MTTTVTMATAAAAADAPAIIAMFDVLGSSGSVMLLAVVAVGSLGLVSPTAVVTEVAG